MQFQDYVTANILKPLGMRHSRYQTSVPAPGTVAPIIQGDRSSPSRSPTCSHPVASCPHPRDMAQLAKVFTNDGKVGGKRILSSAAIQQMAADETATTLRVGPPSFLRYGLGWDSVQDPALKVRWCARLDQRRRHRRLPRVVRHCPDDGLAVVVEGAGRSFSSIAAETVAQTVLLNALVGRAPSRRCPKQVGGEPGKGKVTSKMAKKKIKETLRAHSWPRTETLKLTKGRTGP